MRTAWTAPTSPGQGHRFNFNRLLLDPMRYRDFAPCRPGILHRHADTTRRLPGKDLTPRSSDNASTDAEMRFCQRAFDWDGDQPLRHPWSKTVIYETHVRGFTIHPNSGVDHPGTYRGLMEKIPYLKTLGVTAVELMPVQEFNETSVTRRNPQTINCSRITGDTIPWPSLRPKLPTAVREVWVSRSWSSRKWSGLFTSRHRSDSGRGVQSHGGGKRTGADALFPRDG
jgi:hypothetical protein